MNSIRIFLARLTALFHKRQSEQDLDAEFQFHFDSEVEHHLRAGLTPQQARDAARKRFGGIDRSKEAYRDTLGFPTLEAVLRNLRYGMRTLRSSPSFTVVAVSSLALGIGFTTAIFSLTDQALLRQLPVRDPRSLVLFHTDFDIEGRATSDGDESVFSYPLYLELRDSNPAFDGIIARSSAGVALGFQGVTETADAEMISGNYFPVLGLSATVGRLLTPEDDSAPGAHPVVVLSHRYWTKRFGADPAIVNQTIAINNHSMTVVGVAPLTFRSLQPGRGPDLFVPLTMLGSVRPSLDALNDPLTRWLNLFARRKHGVSPQQAQVLSNTAYRHALETLVARTPRLIGRGTRDGFLNHTATLLPADRGINQMAYLATPLIAMLIMSGLVLVIACANVAGLLLARAAGRQREISIRFALGATRYALMQQLLAEGLLLALPAGLLGILVAWASSYALLATLPSGFAGHWLNADLDPRMLTFAMVTALGCGIAFSLAPAFQGTRDHAGAALKRSASHIAGGAARLRQSMVTGQVALSLLLLVSAGLLGISLYRLLGTNMGFRTDHLLTLEMNATTTRPQPAQATAFYRDFERAAASIPGVTAVAAASAGPLSGSNSSGGITVEGYQLPNATTQRVSVSAGFFQTMNIRLLSGREFDAHDTVAAPSVVVVNTAFAKKYFGSQSPIGRRMQFNATDHPQFTHTIVGVVADFHKQVRDPALATVYLPYTQRFRDGEFAFYLRTSGDEMQIAGQLRPLLRSLDSNVPMNDPVSMQTLISNSIYTERVIAYLAAAFGLVAMLLAVIGLYGVVAYNASRRTREMGLRMALGALPRNVLRLILKEAGVMILAGLALGLAAVFTLARLLESQLFGISPTDTRAIAAAALLLGSTALVAALLPAWRASRVDPVSALKHE